MQKDRYTLIEQSSNFRITCMQHSQKNFMRIIGNDQKNNGQNFWEILERIIGKISSIIGTGLMIKHHFSNGEYQASLQTCTVCRNASILVAICISIRPITNVPVFFEGIGIGQVCYYCTSTNSIVCALLTISMF